MKAVDYIIMVAILVLAASFSLTETEQRGLVAGTDLLGSDGLPRILSALAFLCCGLIMLAHCLKKKGASALRKSAAPVSTSIPGSVSSSSGMLQLSLAIFGIVLYLIAFVEIGFFVSTFLFVLFLSCWLESSVKRHIPGALTFATALVFVCHYSFKFFNLLVPDALLF
jgi:hypothetical protein